MKMFKRAKAKKVKEYLSVIPEERKETVFALHNFIQKAAPTLKPFFTGNMIGYGMFNYKNYERNNRLADNCPC